jgi:hypothetical protein
MAPGLYSKLRTFVRRFVEKRATPTDVTRPESLMCDAYFLSLFKSKGGGACAEGSQRCMILLGGTLCTALGESRNFYRMGVAVTAHVCTLMAYFDPYPCSRLLRKSLLDSERFETGSLAHRNGWRAAFGLEVGPVTPTQLPLKLPATAGQVP